MQHQEASGTAQSVAAHREVESLSSAKKAFQKGLRSGSTNKSSLGYIMGLLPVIDILMTMSPPVFETGLSNSSS
jgi:hypothetical protein